MGSIDTFAGKFDSGLLKPSRYRCTIRNPYKESKEYDLAESINMPGRALSTFQKRRWGPQYDIPYERIFAGEIELTFIMTTSTVSKHRTEFSDWMDEIVDPKTSFINPKRSEYTGDIIVTLEGDNGAEPLSVTFTEAYPKAINPISLSYATVNDYVRQTISFSFREFSETNEPGSTETPDGGGVDRVYGPMSGGTDLYM